MAAHQSIIAAAIIALVLCPNHASASKGFLVGKGHSMSSLDATAFHNEIRNAMSEASGCGGHIGEAQLVRIETSLTPIWRSLPKNSNGRIERSLLRYMAHRYFYKQSSMQLRGYEPLRSVNNSDWGSADILSQRVPAFVESALQSPHAQTHGFDLHDAVKMISTLEELIFDSESAILEGVYRNQKKPTDSRSLTYEGLSQILEEYMVRWMLGGDRETLHALINKPELREESIPHWSMVVDFAKGHIDEVQHNRMHNPRATSRPGHNALAPRYSFTDAHSIVGRITKSFSSFWENQCRDMTATLVKMDVHNTGRVPLSQFYHGALDSEWRFGESESYLRELGALDETSTWRGKQVIIPNYMQAASNCIVSATHYTVCCANYCESILSEIETAIAAPTAAPLDVLYLVGNMSSQTTLDLEDSPQLEGDLTTQLEQIASTHGGKVPLHGRLFAQWLHYAFPRECPFPQKIGTVATVAPYEFGDAALATDAEMNALSETLKEDSERMGRDQEWMSQWSFEEELIADYGSELRSPWHSTTLYVLTAILFASFSIAGVISFSLKGASAGSEADAIMLQPGRSHFV